MKAFTLSTAVLALLLGTSGAMFTASTADAQAAKKATAESRMKLCQERTKGIYRTQQDGWVHVYGYCLANIQPQHWAAAAKY